MGAKGDWTRAHESAQRDEGQEGSWVHAYLHRKEGDQGNAAYWYGRSGKPVCREPLDAEWLSIVRDLLGSIDLSLFGDGEVIRSLCFIKKSPSMLLRCGGLRAFRTRADHACSSSCLSGVPFSVFHAMSPFALPP